MNTNSALNQYFVNSVNTASPAELTLILYNGLVKYLMKAKESMAQDDLQKPHEAIMRAQAIINEFQATLDMKYPISQSLMLLYEYMQRRLIEANLKKDSEIIDEILIFAKELRDTWAIAIKKSKT